MQKNLHNLELRKINIYCENATRKLTDRIFHCFRGTDFQETIR